MFPFLEKNSEKNQRVLLRPYKFSSICPGCQLWKEPCLKVPMQGGSTTLVPALQPPGLTPGHHNVRGTFSPLLTWLRLSVRALQSIQLLQYTLNPMCHGQSKAALTCSRRQPTPRSLVGGLEVNMSVTCAIPARLLSVTHHPKGSLPSLLKPTQTSPVPAVAQFPHCIHFPKHWQQSCLIWLKEGFQYQIKQGGKGKKSQLYVAEMLVKLSAVILQKQIQIA